MIARRAIWLLVLAAAGCGGRARRERDAGENGPVPRPACVVATVSIRDVAEVSRAVPSLAGPALPEAAAHADARLWMSALADLPSDAAAALAARGDAHVLLLGGASGPLAWALPLAGNSEPPTQSAGDGRRMRRAGRHLVIAPDVATLRAVAPFVERTLAPQPVEHAVTATVDAAAARQAADVLLGVVETVTAELRDEAHAMRVQMGRAPEIGEPEAVAAWIEGLGRRAALAAGDAGLQASIDLSERALGLRVVLDARPGTPLARDLAAAEPGPMALAQHVPGDAALAVLVRRGLAERRAASGRTVELLERLAGPRLAPGEVEAFGAALARWDDASGAQGAVALFASTPSPTVLVVGDAARPDEAAAALRGLSERLGHGHLAVVSERLGLWGAVPRGPDHAGRGSAAPASEVAVTDDRVAIAVGPAAAQTLGQGGSSLADLREIADLVRDADGHLVALGAFSPTALVAVLAPLGGERMQGIAAAARTTSSSERAAWSVSIEGRRMTLDLRVPPPELRALAAALRGE